MLLMMVKREILQTGNMKYQEIANSDVTMTVERLHHLLKKQKKQNSKLERTKN